MNRCFILPDVILRNIATKGSPAQKAKAERALIMKAHQAAMYLVLAARPAKKPPAGIESARTVFDLKGSTRAPGGGTKVRSEGQGPTGDVMVNEAYDGAGATLQLYLEKFGRHGIDGKGMAVDSYVHYDTFYENAFFDGAEMCYGDGDDPADPDALFQRFTLALDIIGHELTHGVTQYTAQLVYQDQPGALNESNSDFAGSMVKQLALGQDAAHADWLIGAGLFTKNVQGRALRDMVHPGTAYNDDVIGQDPQPADMQHYVKTNQDNGGVHLNSGIPNRGLALMARNLGGSTWEKAGVIWYKALTEKWTEATDFQGAADTLYASAVELYGDGVEAKAVADAWATVGLPVVATLPTPAPAPSGDPSDCTPAMHAAIQAGLRAVGPHLIPILRDMIAREFRAARKPV